MIIPSKRLLTLALVMPLVAATGARAQEHEKADLDDRFDFLHTLRNPGHFEIDHIRHVIVIYQENWSFDGLYSSFPGADGFPDGTPVTQLDRTTGAALSSVPQPVNGGPDHRFPGPLPVAFYDLSQVRTGKSELALAHNGNLVNTASLRDELIDQGFPAGFCH